jgi:dUTP pyrophosphatase
MESPLNIPMKILPNGVDLPYGFYATPQSAGMDVFAAISDSIVLAPLERKLIPLGFAIALPDGVEAQIRSRSGLSLKHGVCVLNAPGTIDPDYRGELGAVLINFGDVPFLIERGERIAQVVFAKFIRVGVSVVDALPDSIRGSGGFGSTG